MWVFRRRVLVGHRRAKSQFYTMEMEPLESTSDISSSVSLTMTVGEELRRLTVREQQQAYKAARIGRLLGNARP